MPNLSGLWTPSQQLQAKESNIWPGKPNAPTIGTITATSTTVTIPFTAPTNPGFTGISSYTATLSPDGATGTVIQSGSGSITITGLNALTSYTVSLVSNNLLGSSSEVTGSITTAAPPVYVEDVFSTYLYSGIGGDQTIDNGIQLGNYPTNGTVLQLTGDSLTDSSPIPAALTINSGTSVSTSVKKYGSGSLNFSGTSLGVRLTKEIVLTDDFTIECWANANDITQDRAIFGQVSGTSNMQLLRLNADAVVGDILVYADGYMFGGLGSNALAGITSGSWFHLAFSRKSGVCRLFVNGVIKETNNSFKNTIRINQVGLGTGTGENWSGYLDDVRITSGTARYTASFTPPTEALPLDTVAAGKGGLVWTKSRSTAGYAYRLADTARGIHKTLFTNSDGAQETETDYLKSFNSNGFTLGIQNNLNSQTYASWTFRKQPKFFDIVTFTANSSNDQRVPHNLGSVPGFIMIKSTTSSGGWTMYHRSLGQNNLLQFTTGAVYQSGNLWGSSPPSSTDFGINAPFVLSTGQTYVAYIFAHDAGGFGLSGTENVVSCGSYTGNGSAAGPDINLGYEPQWVLIKNTSVSASWRLMDTMRGFSLSQTVTLLPDGSNQEFDDPGVTPTATGFKLNSSNSSFNSNGYNFIYIAIRRGQMKVPTDATKVFTPTLTPSATSFTHTATFTPDASWLFYTDGYDDGTNAYTETFTRLTGGGGLQPSNTRSTNTGRGGTWDSMTSFGGVFGSGAWLFRRAPGFMDVVCYTGTGVDRSVTHNLTVAPEMIIIKSRSSANSWAVWTPSLGGGKTLRFNSTALASESGLFLNAPTATQFNLSIYGDVNGAGANYLAYLFATLPGISKVGSYTGSGTTQIINCGFTNGARFVMIKRTNGAGGNWYIWDSARGIVAGNDPYLLLNSVAAQVTGTDYIDPSVTGFEISSTAPAEINENGGTYIFLAIA